MLHESGARLENQWICATRVALSAIRSSCIQGVLTAVMLAGCGSNGDEAGQAEVSSSLPTGVARSGGLEVSMTANEFEQFRRHRDRFRALPWFRHTAPVSHMRQEELLAARRESSNSRHRGFYVELPSRLAMFSARHIEVDFHDNAITPFLGALSDAFPYFPEIRGLYFENYEREPALIPLLRGSYQLANLRSLAFRDGVLSPEAIAVLVEHPSLKTLYVSRCQISMESFRQLVRLKSLEEIWLARKPPAMPECFITLAQLPRFRAIVIDGDDAFNVHISDDVRRAIESLDGRLEEVVTEWTLTVHPSIVRPLVKVKSLKVLEIGSVAPGLRLADIEPLEDLEKLRHFSLTLDPNDPNLDPAEKKKMESLIGRASRRALERWKQGPRETGYLR